MLSMLYSSTTAFSVAPMRAPTTVARAADVQMGVGLVYSTTTGEPAARIK